MARQSTVYVSAGWKANWGVDGWDLTGQGNDLEHDRSSKEIEGKGFGNRSMVKLPGLQDGDITIKGEHASGEKLNSILVRRYGRSLPCHLWYALEGTAALAPAVMQPSRITSYKLTTKTDDPVEYETKWSSDGKIDDGYVLISPDALVSGATTNGSALNNTAAGGATAAGISAQLHVWSITGGTAPTVAGKVQSSPDGTTWTDVLLIPGTLSGRGSLRAESDPVLAVPAYLRGTITLTGTPTGVQCMLIAARGVDPDAATIV